MTYQTCVGCVHGAGYCHEREATKAKVKGLGVTSLKWKCKHRRPVYQPGDAVWVNLFIQYEDQGDSWGREEAVFREFPGVIIRLKGSRAVMFVEPGCKDEYEEYDFVPQNNGNGHVKIPISRTRRRDAVREHVCQGCERIVRLAGHEYFCRYQSEEERKANEPEYIF